MHKSDPLGGIPLILRDSDTPNPRKGELLCDYENDDLVYVNKQSGEKKSITEDIIETIIDEKIGESTINITKNSDDIEGDEDIIPSIEDRKMNHWFFNILERSERPEDD